MTHVPNRRHWIATLLLGALPLAGVQASEIPRQPFEASAWHAADDAQLDALRGGFQISTNLSISFGFARSISLNGDLVSQTQFNLPDLSHISADQAKLVHDALAQANIIQNGAANTAGATRSPQDPAPLPGTGSAGATLPAGPVVSSIPVTSSPMTVVQNTLSNQSIQSLTVIDAGSNSMGMLRAINAQRILSDALIGAVGVR